MAKFCSPLIPLGEHENLNIGMTLKPMTLIKREPVENGFRESLQLDKKGPPQSQGEIIFTVPTSVIGCIQYKSFTSEIPYYTGFIYGFYPKLKTVNTSFYNVRFDRKTGDATTSPSTSLTGNGSITIPFEWLGLTPNFGWGNDVVR
jgi:hypothetical protein